MAMPTSNRTKATLRELAKNTSLEYDYKIITALVIDSDILLTFLNQRYAQKTI
jgi:hypothetical protein